MVRALDPAKHLNTIFQCLNFDNTVFNNRHVYDFVSVYGFEDNVEVIVNDD